MNRAGSTEEAAASIPARRLTLVISSLGSGGAERVMSILANEWARRGRAITLLTFEQPGEAPFFQLDTTIRHVPLDLNRAAGNVVAAVIANVHRARVIRRAVRASRPDVVVSFMDRTNVLVLLATIGLRVPVVVEEHNDPHEERAPGPWDALRRLAYRRAAVVVTLSSAALAYFGSAVRTRGRVIPNPVVLPRGHAPGGAATGGPTILAVGRLAPQKGFDLLLDAFARLPSDRGWTLEILGEGGMRQHLEGQRDRLGLSGRVSLPGVTGSPGAAMNRARLFVLSSRYEGFPTVLGEAMAVGLPVVAFDCPSGPRQLIRQGVDGLLVPPGDVDGLAMAMRRVLEDESLRSSLAERAPEVLERFGVDRVMHEWDGLFGAVTSPSPR